MPQHERRARAKSNVYDDDVHFQHDPTDFFRSRLTGVPRSIDDLAARAIAGDAHSFDVLAVSLWAETHPTLVHSFRRIPDAFDLAEDVFQNALIRAWLYRASYDPNREGFKAWFAQIAHRQAQNESKRRKTKSLDEMEARGLDVLTHYGDPERILLEREFEAEWERALNDLPRLQRLVLKLHAAGYKSKEIAGILGKSTDATKQIISRAKRKMRQKLV